MQQRGSNRNIMGITLTLLACIAIFILLIRLLEDRFIYYPEKYPAGVWNPEAYGLRVEDCFFQTEDNLTLHGWFVPADSVSAKTLLFFHGNAGNLSHRIDNVRLLRDSGINVFIIDYRGYGRSQGKPSESGLYRDATAARRFLCEKKAVPPENLFIFGRSLGGAVAVELASRHQCAGVILESTFTSAKAMAKQLLPVGPLLKSKFDSINKIAQITSPILIIHGTADELVPYSHGLELLEKAGSPKYFYKVENAGHNDLIYVGGRAYFERIKIFVESQI
ncbi:alpha/beta hydrolase [candidate division KSB1 bacterium]|nr:alpha/beta hydrolase [candidate division KSB1 bacterium]